MSYVVLARKWRPQTFADLVGQEHVSRTLQNAIASGRVAHAFLFTGVRGVGKTTSARILAKALNCMGTDATADGATAEPCLKCAACKEITAGSDLDVQEIDGASYNGVDEIRALQDALPYRPARDRYKIFVIDEVHMLSGPAWNAFLKTLEEPPAHVKFILATTEVHKVPITILSRVQRFDFRMITQSAIAERLRYVLAEEKIASEDAALTILAREAAGSMRDAMSLLDQVLAYDAAQLRAADVAKVLGVASHQVLYAIAGALLQGNAEECIKVVAQLANQGFNMTSVARDMLSLLRDLVVAKVCSDPAELMDLPETERQDVQQLANTAQADDLIRLHQGFSRSFDDVVKSGQPSAALEMLLIRLARRPPLVPIEEWLSRLAALESRLATGGRGSADPGSSSAPTQGGGTRQGSAGATQRGPARSAAPQSPSVSTPQAKPIQPPAVAEAPPPKPASASQSRAATTSPESSTATTDLPASGATASGATASNLDLWGQLLEPLRGTRPELASMLQHVVPISLTGEELVLGVEKGSVFFSTLEGKETHEALKRIAQDHFGASPRITLRGLTSLGNEATLAQLSAEARKARQQAATDRATNHPKVVEALQILGGRIKEVRPAED